MSELIKHERKPCIECQIVMAPKPTESRGNWQARLFCGTSCSVKFRRRARHKKPHPPEVLAAIEASRVKPLKEITAWEGGNTRPGGE